jgi:hypothetical protein
MVETRSSLTDYLMSLQGQGRISFTREEAADRFGFFSGETVGGGRFNVSGPDAI